MSQTKVNGDIQPEASTRNQYHAVAPLEDNVKVSKEKEVKTKTEKKVKAKAERKQSKKQQKDGLKLLGLTIIYFSYACLGSYLFVLIESEEEEQFFYHIEKWKNDTSILLATDLRKVTPYEAQWAKTVYKHLDIFEKDLLKACLGGYRRWDGGIKQKKAWTFGNAFYFSLSLMMTIDYTEVVLRLPWGRLVLILYSSVGIPLTILWHLLIGSHLANVWIWLLNGHCFAKRNQRVHPTQKITGKQYIIDQNATRPSSSAILTSPQYVEKHFDMKIIKKQKIRPLHTDSLVPPILLAIVLLIFYYVFGSVGVYLHSNWPLLDCLVFNFLTLFAVRTGNIGQHGVSYCYLFYVIGGYWLLSMLLHIIYRKAKQKKNTSSKRNLKKLKLPKDVNK